VGAFTTGTLELERGNYGAAQEVLDELARDGVAEDELMLALGQAVLGLRPVDAADAGSQRVLRAAGHAEWLAARSDVAGATREYQQLAAEAPAFHNVQFALGRFLVATHQDEAAVAAFQRELDNTPNHLLARLGLAGVLLATDPARALPYAEQAVRLNPGLGEAHYLLGAALLGTGQTSRALAELETARHIGPEQAKLYYALARAYAKLGRAREAAQARQRFAILNARQQGPGGPPHGKQ
jgi:predicted Zn-dependent protease